MILKSIITWLAVYGEFLQFHSMDCGVLDTFHEILNDSCLKDDVITYVSVCKIPVIGNLRFKTTSDIILMQAK